MLWQIVDINYDMLVMEALSMSYMTHTSAEFFLSLPWNTYERARTEIDKVIKHG